MFFFNTAVRTCFRIGLLRGSHCLFDRVDGTNKWIVHGTVLADW